MKRICCIMAHDSKSDVYYWDEHQGLICKTSPYSSHYVMNVLMKAHFRSMDDTRKMIRQLDLYQKIPLYVGENMMFFPTAGFRNKDCHWIRYDCLKSIESTLTGCKVYLEWRNHQAILLLDCNRRMIVKQMRRCRMIYKSIQSFQFQKILKLD